MLARDKNTERGGDNLWISRAYLRISDHCRVMVRVRVRFAECCIQTAGESDKMRINHVIKTDQWRYAPQTRPAPHFIVSLSCFMAWSQFRCAFRVTVCTLLHNLIVDTDDTAKQGLAVFCSGDSPSILCCPLSTSPSSPACTTTSA